MKRYAPLTFGLSFALAYSASPVFANQTDYQASLTSIYQHASEPTVEDNLSSSVDLFVRHQTNSLSILAHIEAASTPKEQGVATVFPQTNGDARTALTSNNQGRIQLSELYVSGNMTPKTTLHFGLLDSTTFFDTGRIANDENTQFITSDFINNPVIDFPNYAIAGVVEHRFSKWNTTRLLVSSTHGLADNPQRDYSSLFELTKDDKGLYSQLETEFSDDNRFVALGGWMHNGDHPALDDPTQTKLKNYGAYLTAGMAFGRHQFETRWGFANEKVSSAASFASLAYQYDWQSWVMGMAYGHTQKSKFSSTQLNRQEVEVYGRYRLNRLIYLTPSVQYFDHPVYDTTQYQFDNPVWTVNLRLHIQFDSNLSQG